MLTLLNWSQSNGIYVRCAEASNPKPQQSPKTASKTVSALAAQFSCSWPVGAWSG